VLLFLLAFEVLLRVFGWQSAPLEGLFRNDPAIGPRHVAGYHGTMEVEGHRAVIVTDGSGLRVSPHATAPVPGARRVLVLGDSFVFGWGVTAQESVVGRLQQALGPSVEVLNGGHNGWGPDNEALFLEKEGPSLRPELVLAVVYVGNDLWNVLSGPDRAFESEGLLNSRPGVLQRWNRALLPGRIADEPLPGTHESATPSLVGRLLRHSRAWLFVSRRLALARSRRAFPAGTARPLTPRDAEAVFIRQDPPEFVEGWRLVRARLAEMDAWSQAHRARFAVVVAPAAAQVEPTRWAEARRRYGLRDEDFDLEKPQRLLEAMGKAAGYPVIDLLPGLRAAAASGPPLYFTIDPHWNPRGHEAAAAVLLPALRARALVP
jgi:hypothetical protein